jgi:hypothetical protein
MIETLLPTGRYDPAAGRGRFLQLWAPPGHCRTGWTCVVFNGETDSMSQNPLYEVPDELEPICVSHFDEEQESFESQQQDTYETIPKLHIVQQQTRSTSEGYSSDEFEDPDDVTLPLSPVY